MKQERFEQKGYWAGDQQEYDTCLFCTANWIKRLLKLPGHWATLSQWNRSLNKHRAGGVFMSYCCSWQQNIHESGHLPAHRQVTGFEIEPDRVSHSSPTLHPG